LEDQKRVAAFEASLENQREHLHDQLQELVACFPEAVEARLGCQAWPLRPLFLRRDRLEFIAGHLYSLLQAARERLLENCKDPEELAAALGFPPGILSRLDLQDSLNSRHLLSLARPDGFFYADRFVVSELNVGSGLLATLGYSEILYQWLQRSPAWAATGWDTNDLSRPLPRYLNCLDVKAGAHLALLAPSGEVKGIYPWEKTMYEQILGVHGLTSELVEPAELELNGQGQLVRKGSGRPFDLLLQLTSGESFLSEPQVLSDCPWLAGAHVHPLACLTLDKGLLPWLGATGLSQPACSPDGFELNFPRCFSPGAGQAEELRLEKDRFVLKRAWEGKDTVIGCATHGRAWNRAVAEAVGSSRFIAQEYFPLPTVEMPYLIEGQIQRISVRFEVSPFLVKGHYAGAFVRYAPDREGVLLSPSPSDVGMTLVFAS